MAAPLLATKLHRPALRPQSVARERLLARLGDSLAAGRRLTLVSAAAGSGKTTLVSEWVAAIEAAAPPRPVAWLSLDEADHDPARFLAYFIAALQTVAPGFGAELLAALQSPQPPPPEWVLNTLFNAFTAFPGPLVLVLDDYHLVASAHVDEALAALLERLPPRLHLVIATREDPNLPLARLRARDQLAEVRAADLRFTPEEAADFLNRVMGLRLGAAEVAALEARTEGWIAGLQLAALSLQGQADPTRFVQAFSGSHHYVLDYLLDEVLRRQPEAVQDFLLRTSLLDRLCGPLCEAVLLAPAGSGQATLDHLERANLFLVPLDDERRWYRYHHLFGGLLRQRLGQALAADDPNRAQAELHRRASQWYEDNGLEIDAFRHAAAAQDIERAERLMDGKGIPLHLRGAVSMLVEWLEALPPAVLRAKPRLLWRHAAMLLVMGQTTGVEEKLEAAEAALPAGEPDSETRLLIGRIAAAKAVLALTRYQGDALLRESRRALDYLPATSLSLRANANWTLGFGHFVRGERAAARAAYTEAVALGEAARDVFTTLLATLGVGHGHEAENDLYAAADTYRRVLQMAGDQPLQIVHEAHLGLARVLYEWNDLPAAEQHGEQALDLARQYDRVIDRFVLCEVFLARLKLARGDAEGAARHLAQTEQAAREKGFGHRLPDVAAAQVLTLLRQGRVAEANERARAHPLPLSQARVCLAQGEPAAALARLATWRDQAVARDWSDERLKTAVLEALAHRAQGDRGQALRTLGEALALAEPGSFVRTFVDEGPPMARLLAEAAARGVRVAYVQKLLAAFEAETGGGPAASTPPPDAGGLVEPLSQRELEILRLIAQGLSNQAIAERLFLAPSTVKGHNQNLFAKLQVRRRTEAVARARSLGLVP